MPMFGSSTNRGDRGVASPISTRKLMGGAVISIKKILFGGKEIFITSMEVNVNLPPLLFDDEITGRSVIATSSFIKAGIMGIVIEDPVSTEGGTIGVAVAGVDIFA